MVAKIIAVANQKGGSGKTTVSMQLAGAIARRGHRVLVVDADPQGTATRWAASAGDENPFPASVIGLSAANEKVHREVKKFIDDYGYIIIDCPPAADSGVLCITPRKGIFHIETIKSYRNFLASSLLSKCFYVRASADLLRIRLSA